MCVRACVCVRLCACVRVCVWTRMSVRTANFKQNFRSITPSGGWPRNTLLPRSPPNVLRVLFESFVHRYTALVDDSSKIAKPANDRGNGTTLVQVGRHVFITYSRRLYSDYFSPLLLFSLNYSRDRMGGGGMRWEQTRTIATQHSNADLWTK